MSTPATSLDWVHERLPSLLVWKLPVAVLVASALLDLSAPVRGLVWTLAFATMGLGCARNALRCQRVHCYFTAPLYLALATLSLLHGSGAFDLGSNGWTWIGGLALAGGIEPGARGARSQGNQALRSLDPGADGARARAATPAAAMTTTHQPRSRPRRSQQRTRRSDTIHRSPRTVPGGSNTR